MSKKFTRDDVLAIVERAPLVLERDGFAQNALHEWEESEQDRLGEEYLKIKKAYQANEIDRDEFDRRVVNNQMDVYKAKTHCMLGAMHIAALELELLDLEFFGDEAVTQAFDEAMGSGSSDPDIWAEWLESIPSFNDREKTTKKKAIKKFAKLKEKLLADAKS